jgi:hypothetical protein
VSDGGVTWTYYNGIYDQFRADTDTSIFQEKLLEQGILERFAQIHGLDGVQPLFLQQLHDEYGRTKAGKVVYAGGFSRPTQFARSGIAAFGSWI